VSKPKSRSLKEPLLFGFCYSGLLRTSFDDFCSDVPGREQLIRAKLLGAPLLLDVQQQTED